MRRTSDRSGSFKGMRARDLVLFDPALHRHDRGWPHPLPQQPDDSLRQPTDEQPRQIWKTVGILHFAHHDADDGEAEPGNAGYS